MKLRKKMLCIFISVVVLVLNFGIGASAMTTDRVSDEASKIQEESMPDALNSIKETEKLNEYIGKNKNSIYGENLIKISPDKPIVLTFPDGSKIEYKLEVEDTTNFSINDITPQATQKTYKVTKTYFVGSGNVNISISVECTHDGRAVTINRCYDSISGSFARIDYRDTQIIRARGFQGTYAIAEASGMFTYYAPTVGDYYSRTYRIQIHVDPAGAAYLKVLD